MILSVMQRRIGLGCALLLAIALTVMGDDRSAIVAVPKRVERPDATLAESPSASRTATVNPDTTPIVVARLNRDPPQALGVDAFAARRWTTPRSARAAAVPPPAAPVAPPLPFEYAGRIEGREGPTFLLSRGPESFAVHAGEAIDADYRLETVSADTLTFVYVPLNERQKLSVEPVQ
jgi:hypothetical protein